MKPARHELPMRIGGALFFLAGIYAAIGLAAEPHRTPILPAQQAQSRAAPRTVATPAISMTGVRALPLSIATGAVSMTGLRVSPVAVETREIVMTGVR